jgi:hypothetical protein
LQENITLEKVVVNYKENQAFTFRYSWLYGSQFLQETTLNNAREGEHMIFGMFSLICRH